MGPNFWRFVPRARSTRSPRAPMIPRRVAARTRPRTRSVDPPVRRPRAARTQETFPHTRANELPVSVTPDDRRSANS
jgi:hypothetical protein